MDVDYNRIAGNYEIYRTANSSIIDYFAEEIPLDDKVILDFGCGTGNYTFAIRSLTNAQIYGVEPSDNMRLRALEKRLDVRKGDHHYIPFDDNFFDFIYMTDVIHHVPDLTVMFGELNRVLKPGGLVCIFTESHEQLATRYWVKYFPTTVSVEQKRYPDIPVIIETASANGFLKNKIINTDCEQEVELTEKFIALVENKGYSMFHLIAEDDFQKGLESLKKDFSNGIEISCCHGKTLVWLKKG